jgi:membrane fusion protein (multidrug efflux system)
MSVTMAGCKKEQAPPPAAEAPFEVGVVTVRHQSVAITTELPGRTSAYLVAEVRARVDGIVKSRDFEEGAQVAAGQHLYQIDPAPFQAALDSAKANLQSAQANLMVATAQAKRAAALVKTDNVSRQAYDNAIGAQRQAEAQVAAAQAAVRSAEINLGYTDVTSPISGTVGISQVTPGAYVQASAATLMTTVQQTDPIYVDVTQSTVELLRLRRELAEGKLQSAGGRAARVQLILEDGSLYPLEGKLQFTDITVNQTTGSVTLRAVFPNPDQVLLPGMFVRARLQEGINDNAMLVPVPGISHDAKGTPTALVVEADNKVQLRQLATSRLIGNNWVVDSGLNPGDKVIVAGVQKVRPGMVVKPVEQPMTPVSTAQRSPDQRG